MRRTACKDLGIGLQPRRRASQLFEVHPTEIHIRDTSHMLELVRPRFSAAKYLTVLAENSLRSISTAELTTPGENILALECLNARLG